MWSHCTMTYTQCVNSRSGRSSCGVLSEAALSLDNSQCLSHLLTLMFKVLQLLMREMGKSAVGTKNTFSIAQKSLARFLSRFFSQYRFRICKKEHTKLRISCIIKAYTRIIILHSITECCS